MNTCPFANENVACNLSVPETEGNDGGTPKAAYCERCSQVAFRCSSGHWNRAFARFCTQCSQKLEKPAVWNMASANPQRTRTLPQTSSIASLDVNYGFSSWVVDTTEIETGQDLPGLLAIDGLIIIPNPSENRLDAYTVAKPSDQAGPSVKWGMTFALPLTYGSTPVYHDLHLFCVVSGSIQRKPVFGGEAQSVDINGVDAAQIEPTSRCAPLKCHVAGKPIMIAGLKHGALLFDLISHDGIYIKHKFFSENKVMSPVLCGKHLIFTGPRGHIFSLNIGTKPYKVRQSTFRDMSFSAPVSLGDKVYFEALSDNGQRSLARYEPIANKLSKVADLDNESNLEACHSLFIHPPLTDGKRLLLSDRSGQIVYTYDSAGGFLLKNNLPKNNTDKWFVPHQSVVANNRIYSAHSGGLTILNFESTFAVSHQSLAMGRPTNPSPIAPPIRYGDKLFILCRDRLLCRNLGN